MPARNMTIMMAATQATAMRLRNSPGIMACSFPVPCGCSRVAVKEKRVDFGRLIAEKNKDKQVYKVVKGKDGFCSTSGGRIDWERVMDGGRQAAG